MKHGLFLLPTMIDKIVGKQIKQVKLLADEHSIAIEFTDGTLVSFVPTGPVWNKEIMVSLWGVTDFEVY